MNGGDRNNVCVVLGVEVIEIGRVLEVVCKNGAVLYHIIGNNIVAVFLNVEGYVFSARMSFATARISA